MWEPDTGKTAGQGGATRRAREERRAPPAGDTDQMFATVFHESPDGTLVIDAHSGAIIEANRAACQALGYQPAWLVGIPFSTLYAETSAAPPLEERVRLHGAVIEERELRRIDGTPSAVHLRASRATWVARPVIIVTLRDVRERRQAQEARRRAEERFRSIFDNTIEGIFQTTPDGRYIAANPALARIYGDADPDELMARLTDIAGQLYVDPTRRAQFRRVLEATGVVQDFESQARRRDGRVIWISENARAVRDANGVLLYYEGTVIDITQRKQAEAARRSEAEVASALARVGEEMLAAVNSPRIVERLCHFTAEVLDCDWSHTLLWDSHQDAYVPVASAVRDAQHPAPPLESVPRALLSDLLRALDGDTVVVLDADACRGVPAQLLPPEQDCGAALYFAIRRGEVAVGVLMAGYRGRVEAFTPAQVRIARGIAHLAAVALEHARVLDALGRANRLKSEFVATISHELRTPLNIILGYNELLAAQHFGPLTGDQAQVLTRIERSGRELLALINTTLDLSRLETGRMPVDLTWVDLPALAAEIDAEVRDLLRDKPQLTLRWEVAPDLPALHTDAAKLRVIVKNLLNNAVKFTERGSVTVRVGHADDGIACAVSDTGIGIPADALPVIFEAFKQVDGSMTRRHDGVGLGLHVVRRLVELLNGTVTVQSAIGQGSTFRVWLPLRP